MSGHRKPPAWLDLSQPLSDRPKLQHCGWCRSLILVALVGNPCGLTVRADPKPVDIDQELTARLAGRDTYCLRVHRHLELRLINRSPDHIAAGKCTHRVLAEHRCQQRQRTPVPAGPHTDNRLF